MRLSNLWFDKKKVFRPHSKIPFMNKYICCLYICINIYIYIYIYIQKLHTHVAWSHMLLCKFQMTSWIGCQLVWGPDPEPPDHALLWYERAVGLWIIDPGDPGWVDGFIIIHHDSSWFMYWTWLSSSLVLTSRVTWNPRVHSWIPARRSMCWHWATWWAPPIGVPSDGRILSIASHGWSDATKGYDETRLHYIWMSVLYYFWFLI